MSKEILNDPKNIEILENFISCYLDIPLKKVEKNLKIQSRNLKLEGKQTSNKQVDLLLDLKGEKYNIEISNKKSMGEMDRNVVYISAIHARQIKYGMESYKKIQKTIQINLNNYNCNEKNIIETYYLTNKSRKVLTEKLRIDVVDIEIREEGMKQGRKKGLEQRIEQGIEQGKKEQQIEIANKLLEKGFSKEEIKEINKLKKH